MGRLGFQREDRLVRTVDFLALRSGGKKDRTQHFIVVTRPSPSGRSRLGLTVSSRVGNAVERNRIKRVLREYFRLHRDSFASPLEINIVARSGAQDLGLAEVSAEMEGTAISGRP